jgi:hypothetical protein
LLRNSRSARSVAWSRITASRKAIRSVSLATSARCVVTRVPAGAVARQASRVSRRPVSEIATGDMDAQRRQLDRELATDAAAHAGDDGELRCLQMHGSIP